MSFRKRGKISKVKKIQFSVLMSVYYKEKIENLKIAIESIINQTLRPDEFIIVEDGPIGNDLHSLIEEYTKKYNWVKIVKLEKNVGLGLALREGVLHCNYEYVARMDSDDESVSTRFEKQIKFLIENPEIDAIGCNVDEYDEKLQKIITKRVVPETPKEIAKKLKKRNPVNHPTIIYKKQEVIKVNSYEDFPYFEDYHLWAKMIANGCEFYNIQENLYRFRAGASMIKRRGGKKYLRYIKKLEKSLLELGIINVWEYYCNLLKRYFVAIIPNSFRKVIYKIFLRK